MAKYNQMKWAAGDSTIIHRDWIGTEVALGRITNGISTPGTYYADFYKLNTDSYWCGWERGTQYRHPQWKQRLGVNPAMYFGFKLAALDINTYSAPTS